MNDTSAWQLLRMRHTLKICLYCFCLPLLCNPRQTIRFCCWCIYIFFCIFFPRQCSWVQLSSRITAVFDYWNSTFTSTSQRYNSKFTCFFFLFQSFNVTSSELWLCFPLKIVRILNGAFRCLMVNFRGKIHVEIPS